MEILEALNSVAARLRTVTAESIPLEEATGRFLATPLSADRDSPPGDVSAMDGYALRSADAVVGARLEIADVSRPGARPPAAPGPGRTIQIFTGGLVPSGCDLVVKREDVVEPPERSDSSPRIVELAANVFADRMNIRRRGENASKGQQVLHSGLLLHAGHIAAAANFGAVRVSVSRRVRVQVVVTGDELCGIDDAVADWQLRDSNGAMLCALMRRHEWIEPAEPLHVADRMDDLKGCIHESLAEYDVVLITGGVSMGDFDFVPEAVRAAGGEVLFHQLPIRPGKPILGAVGGAGQLILGLPGNPVSAAVGALRFGFPWMAKIGGGDPCMAARPNVELANADDKRLPLTWFRLVRLLPDGRAEIVPSHGSGDLVSLAHSDGFIELPPDASGPGPWPFSAWE